jgi:pyruvate formate lyase activating enzyme
MENKIDGYPTKYWHSIEGGRIQCDLCPHYCKLKEGQRGLCFIRARGNNQIILTTYGLTSGLAIDPVEKKPLNHFLPGTSVFSFGTIGCNLSCLFCQNWDISKCKKMDRLGIPASPNSIAKQAYQHQCQSVAFTYNEPTVFMEYAIDVAKECHKLGIKTVSVTNGYICDAPRQEFYGHIDAANVDLKGFTDQFYKKIIGGSLQPVLDTLCYLKQKTNVWLEITTLLIPGENDSEEEIDQETKWLMQNLGPDVPLHFTAFHPAWKMLDKQPTSIAALKRSRDIALKNGLHYVYIGNVHDTEDSTTYCHNCKSRLIVREGYQITLYQLNSEGRCKFCGTKCSGVFS